MIIGEPSIWVAHRLVIAYGTIALLVLVIAAVVFRRMRLAIAKERSTRQREESLREFPRPAPSEPDAGVA